MKKHLKLSWAQACRRSLKAPLAAIASLFMLQGIAFAQLPTPCYGWNLGNTLEPPCGEGCWSPLATQALINSVAAQGFNVVRIPCAWNSHANQSTYQIDSAYMNRVKQVVDWCLARNMYVVINSHWDNGWLESNITDTVNPTINAKMNSYWGQIATAFAGYDNRLLFAGANEPVAETAAQWNTLRSYLNTFISAVRSKGGNNTTRWLVVQGPRTDINLSDSLVTSMPADSTSGRLMFEVHFYDPFNFTLHSEDAAWGLMSYFWGSGYHSTTNPDRNTWWGEEAHVDAQFQKMKTKFVDKGIPVMVGEFAAMKRTSLTGADLNLHLASRTYWHKYVANSMRSRGLYPIFWDTAGTTFDWTTGAVLDQANITALKGGAALPPPGGGGGGVPGNGTYKIVSRHSGKAMDAAGVGTANGTQIHQWTYGGGNHQRWTLLNRGNNQFSIIGVHSGRAIEVSNWGAANGTKVQLWDWLNGSNQKYTFTATSGGYYRITPTHATGSCLDVAGVSTADGALVHLWSYGGGNNQQWAFQAP
jgi:endoglucanase